MDKYLGNKAKIAEEIFDSITSFSGNKSGSVFDAFSGTTNIGRCFKSHGFNVISNDINDLSYVLGKCYLTNSQYPSFDSLFSSNKKIVSHIMRMKQTPEFEVYRRDFINLNKHLVEESYLKDFKNENFISLLVYLTYFSNRDDISDLNYKMHMFVTENYTEYGNKSNYINLVFQKGLVNIAESLKKKNSELYDLIQAFLRPPFEKKYLEECLILMDHDSPEYLQLKKIYEKPNLIGKRKFFSKAHAQRIDLILNTICALSKEQLLLENEYYYLLCSLLESVALFSNTSATYQAFYKTYRANTLQNFRLVVPILTQNKIDANVTQLDSYKAIPEVKADILYLDPPYNWRQYDSNYHLLNTLARYREIKNVSQFEKNIVGASGENRVEKLQYTSFNNNSLFQKRLFEAIIKSPCRIIAVSYSDSISNHKKAKIYDLLEEFNKFFGDSNKFTDFKLFKIDSINFESRKGNKKQKIHELLFVAIKK
jgi:adenine-specific DNA-methyltransferase